MDPKFALPPPRNGTSKTLPVVVQGRLPLESFQPPNMAHSSPAISPAASTRPTMSIVRGPLPFQLEDDHAAVVPSSKEVLLRVCCQDPETVVLSPERLDPQPLTHVPDLRENDNPPTKGCLLLINKGLVLISWIHDTHSTILSSII